MSGWDQDDIRRGYFEGIRPWQRYASDRGDHLGESKEEKHRANSKSSILDNHFRATIESTKKYVFTTYVQLAGIFAFFSSIARVQRQLTALGRFTNWPTCQSMDPIRLLYTQSRSHNGVGVMLWSGSSAVWWHNSGETWDLKPRTL